MISLWQTGGACYCCWIIRSYRKTPEQYKDWRCKGTFYARYPVGRHGHSTLFAVFDSAARRKGVLVFKGWEVGEDELDSTLEIEPMMSAEVCREKTHSIRGSIVYRFAK